ncbi:hypothetical protein C1645_814490 [Glomus cerebriforme]|uniref:Uncharacterized protein n=1 Tax=Glomus cerebriforme TaxID=658196 RepID=A0A397TGQ9_9GLOM|nr:hypothetical protein C1645_814490 [Glomus cerebriforme]
MKTNDVYRVVNEIESNGENETKINDNKSNDKDKDESDDENNDKSKDKSKNKSKDESENENNENNGKSDNENNSERYHQKTKLLIDDEDNIEQSLLFICKNDNKIIPKQESD